MTAETESPHVYRVHAAGRSHACSACGTLQVFDDRCSACGDGPLLDLRDENVRVALAERDELRRTRFERRVDLVAMVLAAGFVMGGIVLVPEFGVWLLRALPYFLAVPVSMIATAFATAFVLRSLLRYRLRFPYLRSSG